MVTLSHMIQWDEAQNGTELAQSNPRPAPGHETMIPLVDLRAQYQEIKHEVEAAIHRVLKSSRYVLGPEVEASKFARRDGEQQNTRTLHTRDGGSVRVEGRDVR